MSTNFICKKLKTQRKQALSATALILLLAFSAFIAILPTAGANTPAWNVPTYIYISVSQNPTGVSQPIWITMWLNIVPPGAAGFGGDRYRDLKVEVTKPDGNKEIFGPYISDPIGTKSIQYTPTQIGTYYFQAIYPGQTWTGIGPGGPQSIAGEPGSATDYVNDTFLASTSTKLAITVQKEPSVYPGYPLPGANDFWRRPLYADIKDWSTYASNWLGGSQLQFYFQPYGTAPNSAHILWTKPLSFGGSAGDQFGDIPYGTDDYENPWSGGIIIQGRLYYNQGMYPKYGFYCVDLRTGEEIWYNNNTELNNKYLTYSAAGAQSFPQPSFGQLYWYHSINGQGILAYLWCTVGTNWIMLDALTGNWILTLQGVPSGTTFTDPVDGSLLQYTYNKNGWLSCWNSSAAIPPLAGGTSTNSQQWKPRTGATINATYDPYTKTSGYTWNKTAPKSLPGSISWVLDDRIIGSTLGTGSASAFQPPEYTVWALSTKQGQEGTLLWTKNYIKPPGNLTLRLSGASLKDKVFVAFAKETRQYYGYDLDSGDLLWGPTASEGDWNMYNAATGTMGTPAFAYGKMYMGGYSGVLRAYDVKTGKVVWTYNNTANIGAESPYGQYTLTMGEVADGKIYMYSSEHSPTKPLWRGSEIRCLNATTGQELWTVLTFARGVAIADGCLVTVDIYSSQIEVFGKGPSALTVSAPQTAVPSGTQVLIQGTVADQSAGAKQKVQDSEFSVVPAMSDDSMGAWMEYVYMQKPIPTNATGVPVTLSVFDSNNNTYTVGATTSDADGNFGFAWTPPVPGLYKVTATFEGSNSYYGSHAATMVVVSKAPAASVVTPAPTQTAAPTSSPVQTASPTASPSQAPQPTSGMPTTTYIAIGAAVIVVVAAAAVLVLRKRKSKP